MDTNELTTKSVYSRVKKEAGLNADANTLLDIFNKLLSEGVWSEGGLLEDTFNEKICPDAEYTAHGIRNIVFARLILSKEKTNIIGENNIACAGMTTDKLIAIEFFTEEAVKAIGGQNISDTGMTVEKLEAILRKLNTKQVKAIGNKLPRITGEIIDVIKDANFKMIEALDELILSDRLYPQNLNFIVKNFKVDQIVALGDTLEVVELLGGLRTLSVEQIGFIGASNLNSDNFNEIRLMAISQLSLEQMEALGVRVIINQGLTVRKARSVCQLNPELIKVLGGEKFLSEGMTPDKIDALEDFAIGQIEALGVGNIISDDMTAEKLIFIENTGIPWIDSIGGKTLVEMNIAEMKSGHSSDDLLKGL